MDKSKDSLALFIAGFPQARAYNPKLPISDDAEDSGLDSDDKEANYGDSDVMYDDDAGKSRILQPFQYTSRI